MRLINVIAIAELLHQASSAPGTPRSVSGTPRPVSGSATDASSPHTAAPAPAATAKLRTDYPFLSSPGCPPELKILVSDRITAWHTYTEAWQQLFSCETDADCARTASRLIDAYLENRRIGDELDHYRDTGRVLGRHPVFARYAQLKRLRTASVKDLLLEQRKTRDNIWRVKSELKKGDKPHLTGRRQEKLKEYELKLQEINRLLGEE